MSTNGNICFTLLVTSFVFIFFPESSVGRWVCEPCRNEEECEEVPVDFCRWGEVRDACGRRICGKGPGERCGGPFNALGNCGSGLMCRNERCRGCSWITMKCDTN